MHQILSGYLSGGLLRLPPWLNSLIVLLLAYSLAGVSWRLWQETAGGAAPLPLLMHTPQASGSATTAARPGLEKVAALHLFGEADKTPVIEAPKPSTIEAPETRLQLTLRGIIAVSAGGVGRALIAEGRGQEKLFKTGDEVSAGAVLYEVQADKVILKRAGRFETLTLPRDRIDTSGKAAAGKGSASKPRSGVRTSSGSNVSSQLRELRDQVVADPAQAAGLVNVQPVMEGGAIKGYRVSPIKYRSLFRKSGMRVGDVVTQVNGIPVGDVTQMATLFDQFKTRSQFELTVERGGRQTSLTLDLGNE